MGDSSNSAFDHSILLHPFTGEPLLSPTSISRAVETSTTSSFRCEHQGAIVTIVYEIKHDRHFCPQPGCLSDFGLKDSLRQHHNECHLLKRPFICILCNASFSRRRSLRDHFPGCERKKQNPNNHTWDAHPSCEYKRHPHKQEEVKREEQKPLAVLVNNANNLPPANAIHYPNLANNNNDNAIPLPPPPAAYPTIESFKLDTLINLAFEAIRRSARDLATNPTGLSLRLRDLVEELGDAEAVRNMDDVVVTGDFDMMMMD